MEVAVLMILMTDSRESISARIGTFLGYCEAMSERRFPLPWSVELGALSLTPICSDRKVTRCSYLWEVRRVTVRVRR
jgi:hypothetical protein